MKLINCFASLVLISLMLLGCFKKDTPEPESAWIGEWVNKENPEDVLIIEKNIINRFDLVRGEFNHKYNYEIIGDSVSLKYNGKYYIYVETKISIYT